MHTPPGRSVDVEAEKLTADSSDNSNSNNYNDGS